MRPRALMLALMLAGCASASGGNKVPTLYVENITDTRWTVYADARRVGIVEAMRSACLTLHGLPAVGEVTLYFRALAGVVIASQPTAFQSADGWALMMAGRPRDGGFFAHPAKPCK